VGFTGIFSKALIAAFLIQKSDTYCYVFIFFIVTETATQFKIKTEELSFRQQES